MRKMVLIGLVLVLVAGCASQAPYVPPKDGPVASISFVNVSPDTPTTVLFYEDGLTCKGLRRLAFYSTNYSESSVVVPANKPFTFTVDHSTTRKYCRQTYMFTPEQFDYRVRTVTGTEECALVVERVDKQDKSNWTPIEGLTKREYRAPFFESGEWCAPL